MSGSATKRSKKPAKESASKKRRTVKRVTKTVPSLLPSLSAEFDHLANHGWQVVENVLDAPTCDALRGGIENMFRSLGTGLSFEDASTWRSSNLPFSLHRIYQHGIAHYQPLWDVRQNPAVHDVFARLWQTPDLLVSFDGMCVMEPPEWSGKKMHIDSWFHFDQGPRKLGRHCIQGLVTLEDMSSADGTLMVIDSSHNLHLDFFRNFGMELVAGDWHKFTKEQSDWLLAQPGLCVRRISAPKGSLVLWDSRTAHCNQPPQIGRPHPRWRFVVYVCMMPRKYATPKDLAKKLSALNELRVTSHWPCKVKLFGKAPRAYGGVAQRIFPPPPVPPTMTPLGRRLAGFND
eukprot:gnl/Spiro4/29516_TR14452_c0_g4_i1.p1 gnl/Spiro4/29516_TR14452_c0_g4~~gnl/Spiro4/29516_TR14452_c0_g4_i1.p1  ORF type:complete len:356 (-),score=52.27 gnl/Spiro4/29516_TR14452_c0_g4_i1:43-1080(-)